MARQALKTYTERFADEKNASRFGFRSASEAAGASLGEPLPVALLTLADLKQYGAGATARSMVKDAQTLWFPVMVGNEVRAKLEMVRRNGNWSPGEFGSARTAARIGTVRSELPERMGRMNLKAESITLVRVPALNAAFLLIQSPSGEYMTPAAGGTGKYGLETGTLYRSSEVLATLSKVAAEVDPKKVM